MEKVLGIITANYASSVSGKVTKGRPLASLPFFGRYRLVDFALSNMVNSGIDTVGLVMPSNYRSIIDHVGSGKDWGLDRKNGGLFILPGTAFGTARKGGRFLLRDLINNEALLKRSDAEYVACSGANFACNVDVKKLIEVHKESRANITVLTAPSPRDNPDISGFELDERGRVKALIPEANKDDAAFLDFFVVDREFLLDLLDRYAEVDHLGLFEALAGDYRLVDVRAASFDRYVAPIFTDEDYFYANLEALNPQVTKDLFPTGRTVMTKAHDTAPAKYEVGSSVTNSAVSAGCRIFGTVRGSILGRNVIVEPGATVVDSIIMQSCIIREGAYVENAIIDRNNVVPAGTEYKGTKDDVLVIEKPYKY